MPRIASLLLALQAAAAPAQPPAPPAPPPAPPAPAAAAAARADSAFADTLDRRRRRPRREPRRQAVTAEHERTAFSDERARTTFHRARAARMSQDSALRAYDAKTYQRLSVGMGVRRVGRDRLLLRTEHAARVRWSRDVGLWLEPTGRRNVAPMLKEAQKEMDVELDDIAPVPYFPGRETLWFPSGDMGVARAEVDEREMLHPLATGAEAYYRYTTGDSVTIRLPDGKAIMLRELQITARKPEWRAFVGSFWFDAGSGHLVRAAYRMAADMNIWDVVEEENSAELREARARARTDTSAAARDALRRAEREVDDDVPVWVKGMMNPMRANISAITVEYGLHQGRFWMPRRNVAEGEAQAGFLRVPVKVEETFKYASVNGDDPVPPLPERRLRDRPNVDSTLVVSAQEEELEEVLNRVEMRIGERHVVDTTLAGRVARADSSARAAAQRSDSLRASAAAARLRGDTATARRDSARARTYAMRADARQRNADGLRRRIAECAQGDSYVAGVRSRYDGAVRVAVRMPCDTSRLSQSSDLPPSPYENGEQLFGEGDRDELLKALDLGLQPGWAPEKPKLRSGLDLLRYDRVEGLSVGGLASATLGRGYDARLEARIGTADWVPNADLSVTRSNGRVSIRAGAFHRLAIANDDWGGPLTFGASVASLLYARDEGFYYRTWGAELAGTRDALIGGATAGWRLFVEQQRSAGVEPNTQASLAGVFGGTSFIDNIDAAKATSLGASGDLARGWGLDPDGWRVTTRARAEAAWVDLADGESDAYGRGMLEATVSHGIGRHLAASVTGAAGSSVGTLTPQRGFYVGGLQTVRGQWASPTGENQVGDAFWLGRTELGLNRNAFRPVVFYDLGWAGARDRFGKGQPISGAGIGASFLDGLVRLDVSRGIRPDTRWRFDMSVDARF